MSTLAPERAPGELFNSPPPYAQEAPPYHPPEGALEAPYYTLNEVEIRAKVTRALVEAEAQKATGLATAERKPTPLIIGVSDSESKQLDRMDAEGQIQDIDKARVMAEAEHPYRIRSVRKAAQAQQIVDTLIDPESWWSIVREPIKIAKAARLTVQRNLLLTRAANAAALAGLEFDRIIEAAQPYVPRINVSDTVTHFLKASQQEDNATDTAEPAAPTATEITPQAETLATQLRLDAQLAEQLQILQNSGILQRLSNGEMGITDEEGTEYPAPTPSQLHALIEARKDLVTIKAAHGFTRLLAVPQATSAAALIEGLTHIAIAHRTSLHDADGQPFELPQSDKKELFADLAGIDKAQEVTSKERGSLTPGWKVVLIKNMPQSPRYEREIVVFGGRGEFMVGDHSAKRSVAALRNSPFCIGESGFSLHMWLAYSLSELERSGTVVDANGGTLLLGSVVRQNAFLRREPSIGWKRIHSRGTSREKQLQLTAAPRWQRSFDVGLRTAVELS